MDIFVANGTLTAYLYTSPLGFPGVFYGLITRSLFMTPKLTVLALASTMALTMVGMATAQEPTPGKLVRLEKAGTYEAQVGDLIEIDQNTYSDSGPEYFITNVKVEIKGEGVLPRKATIVLVPPSGNGPGGRPAPGATSELRAYLPAEGTGDATVTLTPIGANGKPRDSKVFTIKVSKPSK